jgi:hypothetical protein
MLEETVNQVTNVEVFGRNVEINNKNYYHPEQIQANPYGTLTTVTSLSTGAIVSYLYLIGANSYASGKGLKESAAFISWFLVSTTVLINHLERQLETYHFETCNDEISQIASLPLTEFTHCIIRLSKEKLISNQTVDSFSFALDLAGDIVSDYI